MSFKNIVLIIVGLTLVISTAIITYKFSKPDNTIVEKAENTEVSHQVIVEKIEHLGKLELVKFLVKDIIEHKTVKQWWPDPKVVLIASGEVAGCIDLKKIDTSHITIEPDKISVKLPAPEICFYKVDHQNSKVYTIEYGIFEEAALIDQAYKVAEKQIMEAALKMDILNQTKQNAVSILTPFIQNLTGKKVEILF
ncbi:MAG TPA: DUF4230 domain-containing protein [Cytophagaceae bacterium]